MRTVFVAAYLLGSVPSLVAQGVTLDPLRLVREDRIPEGPYRGGFLVAPNGKLNWYFANLGLRAFIRDMPTDVRTYLDLYIAHLRPDATIQDVIFAGSDWDHPQLLDSDSDDSYAASFLSLAIAYTRQTGDFAWFSTNAEALANIAQRNLIAPRNEHGLTYNFQDPAKLRAVYLEDNIEVWAALRDIWEFVRPISPVAAELYHAQELVSANGIMSYLLVRDSAIFRIADPEPAPSDSCYPDYYSQAFPDAYDFPIAGPGWPRARQYLEAHVPDWATITCGGFPWAMLGYVAATHGDYIGAWRKLEQMDTLAADPDARGKLAIHELGWYRRTRQALQLDPL